jgi:hypothetical protein
VGAVCSLTEPRRRFERAARVLENVIEADWTLTAVSRGPAAATAGSG